MSETITLQWDNNNEIEQGYRIYRSDSPMDIDNMPMMYDSLGQNITQYVDNDVIIGNTYYYRVSSYIENYELFSDEIQILARENVPVYIYSGDNSGHITMQDIDGNIMWQTVESVSIRGGVVGDFNNNVYAGLNDGRIIKKDFEGNTIWENNSETSFVYSVSINPMDNTVAASFYNNIVVSYTDNGKINWTYDTVHGRPYTLTHDNDGYTYVSGYQYIEKIDNGINIGLQQSSLPIQQIHSMTIHNDYLYIGTNNSFMVKLDTDLNIIWEHAFNVSDPIHGIDLDDSDNIIVGVGKTLYKMDSNKNVIWEWLMPGDNGIIRQVTLSHNDDIFVSTTWKTVYRISKTGNTIWSFDENLSNLIYGVSTNKVPFLQEHDQLSVSFVELQPPTPLNAVQFYQIVANMTAPIVNEITASIILEYSKPTNVRGTYDDTL